jgi:hypothetical protein
MDRRSTASCTRRDTTSSFPHNTPNRRGHRRRKGIRRRRLAFLLKRHAQALNGWSYAPLRRTQATVYDPRPLTITRRCPPLPSHVLEDDRWTCLTAPLASPHPFSAGFYDACDWWLWLVACMPCLQSLSNAHTRQAAGARTTHRTC